MLKIKRHINQQDFKIVDQLNNLAVKGLLFTSYYISVGRYTHLVGRSYYFLSLTRAYFITIITIKWSEDDGVIF